MKKYFGWQRYKNVAQEDGEFLALWYWPTTLNEYLSFAK